MEEASKDQDETEEVVLLVELTGLPNPDVIKEWSGACSILGIDTAEPVLQLDNFVFRGRFEETLGTCLFFKQDAEGRGLSYICKTTKKLCTSRVILRKKGGRKRDEGDKKETESQEGGTAFERGDAPDSVEQKSLDV